jgi:hypothetical protein
MLWLLIGYMFLFIHRPFEVWPGLGEMRIELLYALTATLVWAVLANKRWLPNRLHLAFFGFAAVLVFSWLASPWADRCQPRVEDYFKLFFFYVVLVTIVRDEWTLHRIVTAYLVVMAIYMTHSLAEYINGRHVYRMSIPRMVGVDMSLGDPNSFGASIVYALPFVVPLWHAAVTPRRRAFLAGYVCLSVLCIVLTGSRSSFSGLLLCGLIMVLRTRWRGRLLPLAVLVVPLLWAALPGFLQDRFETIINPEAGPANAAASAEGRVQGLLIGVQLWERFPLTGCGPGAWRPASGAQVESHNLYGQVIGEVGTLGALAFLGVLLGFWANLRRIKQAYQDHPEWGHDFPFHLARAIGLALFLLLAMGAVGHNLYRYSWLWYGGFLVIARHCIEQRLRAVTMVSPERWRVPAWPIPVLGRRLA